MRTLLEAFLSDAKGADAYTAIAMRRIRAEGAGAMRDLSDPAVLAVEKAAHRARMEANLMCGLVRFSELSDGAWYAPVEPACDVLVLAADHFAARFGPMRFAIHDLSRGAAILHEPGRGWELVDGFSLKLAGGLDDGGSGNGGRAALSETEIETRRLWKAYFASTAIQARANPALQSSKMPKRYWRLLVEMDGEGVVGTRTSWIPPSASCP